MANEYNSRTERRRAQESGKSKQKKTNNTSNKRGWLKKTLIAFLILGIIGIVAGGVTAFAIIRDAPPLDEDELVFSEAAEFYDANNEFVTQLEGTENRSLVDIEEVPEDVKNAFIAVEDERFYSHSGVDVRRVFGAVFANISEGFGAEGASTITQQLVKHAFLSPEQTMSRKLQEQWLAIQLEREYSKDEILEMYLNAIWLGNGAYGIEKAGETYFSKSVEELSVEDAAVLAAIPRRPSYYDPIANTENAEQRRNLILNMMHEQELIDSTSLEEAQAVSLEEQLNVDTSEEGMVYQSFIEHVQNELEDIPDIESSDLYNAGLEVYTTLDPNVQETAETVIQTDQYIQNYPDHENHQIGMTLMDTNSGAVRAIVGGREPSEVQRGTNYATAPVGQPGSTAKPLISYAPAIETEQMPSTGTIIADEEMTYETQDDVPVTNFDNNYLGDMTMREALIRSRNVPAVKAMNAAGREEAERFAEDIGFSFESFNESYALGGFDSYVSTKQMAGAYATLGNGGRYNEPYAVRKIVFPDGREMTLEHDSEPAMQDHTAYMVTDMLKDVFQSPGTGTAANVPGLPMAGKTGTTNFSQDERQANNIPAGVAPETWFAGYTTEYTAAVWNGFSQRGSGYLERGAQRQIPQDIFRHVMEDIHQNQQTEDFARPDSVVELEIDSSTGLLPGPLTPSDNVISELFIRGHEPSEETEAAELDPVSGLTGSFDEDTDQITVTWDYDAAVEDVEFRISHSTNGDEPQQIDEQSEMQFLLEEPELDTTHTFEVTAFLPGENLESSPASVEISTPDEDAIEEDDEDDEDEDEDEDEDATEEEDEDGVEEEEPDPEEAPGEAEEENNNGAENGNGPPEDTPGEGPPEDDEDDTEDENDEGENSLEDENEE
ncbi:penicillin-binding protein 1A [Salsuginibacillus halophilus]|uniref:Penicillin-binding protein 1A n=1 Tax=Salsuginibacillus halophilus TaxID=517424 RepID=A0A2P8HWD1_9BACI|nr:PBP1A family penicillin-binding protein [Salsuginibacillus halophilus]PSL50541.1 penicillin-binding protein 1A [Salsuginibacillus halophilus]